MKSPPCTLSMQGGRLHARLPEDDESRPVMLRYLRPLSARSEVSLVDDEGKELLLLSTVDELAPACRPLATAELERCYHMPRISAVSRVEIRFGTLYCHVETDKGAVHFAIKEPGRSITWLDTDHILITDTMGNRYEIEQVATLDAESRRELDKIL